MQRYCLHGLGLSFVVCLLFCVAACGGGGSNPGPAPALDPNGQAPDFQGTFAVTARFVEASGSCSDVLGEQVSGALTFTRTSSGYSVYDGDVTLPMVISGNYGTFSYAALGITQVWRVTVYANGSRLYGEIQVSGPQGCQARALADGTRTSAAMAGDGHGAGRVLEAIDLGDHGSECQPVQVFFVPPQPRHGDEPGLLDRLAQQR